MWKLPSPSPSYISFTMSFWNPGPTWAGSIDPIIFIGPWLKRNSPLHTYRVKEPQFLSTSTKATPIKPSTFRIRFGFCRKWKHTPIKMLTLANDIHLAASLLKGNLRAAHNCGHTSLAMEKAVQQLEQEPCLMGMMEKLPQTMGLHLVQTREIIDHSPSHVLALPQNTAVLVWTADNTDNGCWFVKHFPGVQ